jgi:hypothetical protein
LLSVGLSVIGDGITTVTGMAVYQRYSRESPSDTFAVAVTMASSVLAWLVTGLE